jgi:Undecaprenyl-phosphate glucose phosphotransferase
MQMSLTAQGGRVVRSEVAGGGAADAFEFNGRSPITIPAPDTVPNPTGDGTVAANHHRRRWAICYNDISYLVAALDFAIILATAALSGLAYSYAAYGDAGDVTRNLAVSVFVGTFFVFLTRLRKLYDPTELLIWNNQLQNVLLIWGCTFVFLGGLVFSLGLSKEASRGEILWFAISGVVGLAIHRLFWRTFIERALAKGSLAGRKAVVIGWDFTEATTQFMASLRRHGFQVVRQFSIGDFTSPDLDNRLASAISFVRGSDVEEIYLLMKRDRMDAIGNIVERLRVLPVSVTLIPDATTAELVRHSWHQIGHAVAIELQRPPLSAYERTAKRVIDVLGASLGLLTLLPLLVLMAVAIKIESPGPVLFRQTRNGFNGKRFKIFKFRSMFVLEDGPTIKQATTSDRRVTCVGALIRRSSIDEIPQLLNVLIGDMSIVGPRPHAAAHDDYYLKQIEKYAFRHHVKPGLTGWAQVNGHRGETKTLDKMRQRVECDLWYINNWSLWLDVTIMLRTVSEVVRGENAY